MHKLKLLVRSTWLHSAALIEQLKQSGQVELSFEGGHDEILIGDVSLRLTAGQSAVIEHAHEKVVLMDWHANWKNAKAVAITASPACAEQDLRCVEQFFVALNMIPIWTEDHAGLYVLRTISMLVNEACEAVLHNIASEQDIDSAMKYGVNYPQGPFEWADKIGYSIILQNLENMYRIYGEERYRPSIYLKKKAALGQMQKSQLISNLCAAG